MFCGPGCTLYCCAGPVILQTLSAAGDALRPFLMHAFGGLYIDLDVQCFRSAEPSLLGHDIVLQSEYREGRDIVNSIMASVPGHPFWKAVITEMLEVSILCLVCGHHASMEAEAHHALHASPAFENPWFTDVQELSTNEPHSVGEDIPFPA